MSENKSYFLSSEGYDLAMGRWSRGVGEKFLDWLGLLPGLRWLDVGCGTGAFTELLLDRCSPTEVSAIDPLEDQIALAREKTQSDCIDYRQGDASALPYEDAQFDVAVMALVAQFLPDPQKAMSEICRVVKPGGTIAAYVWDLGEWGSPGQPVNQALKSMGFAGMRPPPSVQLRAMDALADLFSDSGLADVDRHVIEIRVDFKSFDEFWAIRVTNALTRISDEMTAADIERLKSILKDRLVDERSGEISYTARANAVRGAVAK
jgi:ubiquinone/menaquinone biosynthesis C-methylase UbiE